MAAPELRTERLVLRHWRDSDLKAFAALNSVAQVMEFFPAALRAEESNALAERIGNELRERAFGLWAVEIPGVADFAGFAGLSVPGFDVHFMPAVEIGWRLARPYWGFGYATEAAGCALQYGFDALRLAEVVSFTSAGNMRSRRVMERLGMRHEPRDDFQHPLVGRGSPLRAHVLYRISQRDYVGELVRKASLG